MTDGLVDQWNLKLADDLEAYFPLDRDLMLGTTELMGVYTRDYFDQFEYATSITLNKPIAKNFLAAKWALEYIVKHLKEEHRHMYIVCVGTCEQTGLKEWGLRLVDSPFSRLCNFCENLRNLPCSKLTNGGSLLELSQNFCTDTPGAWGWWQYMYIKDGISYLKHTAMEYGICISTFSSTSDLLFWIRQISHKNKNVYGDSVLDDLLWAFNDIFGRLHLVPHEFKAIDLMNAYEQRVFGAKNNTKRSMPTKLRHQILERDGFKCMDCGKSPQTHSVTLEVDHRLPFSKGGSNDPSNLRTLCSDCNGGKSDRIINYPEGHQ